MKKTHIVVITALFLIILFVLASFLVTGQKQENATALARKNAEALIREHSPVLGDPAAKVTITEFMDPACETCRAFDPFLKQVLAAYPGKIKLVVRYAPLHQGAVSFINLVPEAGDFAAIEVAGDQGGLAASPGPEYPNNRKPPQLIQRLEKPLPRVIPAEWGG